MSEPLPNSTSEINDALSTKETSLGNTGVAVVGSGYPNGGVPVVEGDDEEEESDTYDVEDDQEGGEEYDEEDEDEGTGEKKSSLTALLLGNSGPGGPTQNGAPDHQGVEVIEDGGDEDEDDDEEYVDERENGYGQGHGDNHPGAIVENDGEDYDDEGGDEEDEGPEVEELPDPNFAASNGSKKRTIDEVHEDAEEDGEEGAGVKKVKA